jgi:hypothetical protein
MKLDLLKHYLGNTNDVNISLNKFLDFNPIKIYFKSISHM